MALSPSTYRRTKLIIEYGSPEIQQLCHDGKLSIWRAYNHVKREHERKVFCDVERALAEAEQLPSNDGKEVS